MKTQLASIISLALDQILDDSSIIDIHIERPKTLEHGDYSTNIALQLTKILKKNPREIAQLIIEKIGLDPSIDRLEIAGPGFINFYLSAAGKSSIIKNIFTQSINYGHNEAGKNQKLQVEFVSANPTGPLHIGHGRGAAIGDSLARIMQANG